MMARGLHTSNVWYAISGTGDNRGSNLTSTLHLIGYTLISMTLCAVNPAADLAQVAASVSAPDDDSDDKPQVVSPKAFEILELKH